MTCPHGANTSDEHLQLHPAFNNMWSLKFKGQPTNAFFAAVEQSAERAVIKC